MKITQLSILLHSCKIEFRRLSLSPYHLLITLSSGMCLPLIAFLFSHTRITVLSWAIRRAMDVLPVPGGPSNRMERGSGDE